MGFIRTIDASIPHKCDKPSKDFGVGTIWECDECKQQYKLVLGLNNYHKFWVKLWFRRSN